ncbi:unnamed protein product [Polarella glacialis]|uniref:Uncharacterized protein n=1 Tax=Polarella glacialis TaxID=89957 RepID=A0A813M2G9_POLGL|nr:unnamed protein product [Polarella glacialis]
MLLLLLLLLDSWRGVQIFSPRVQQQQQQQQQAVVPSWRCWTRGVVTSKEGGGLMTAHTAWIPLDSKLSFVVVAGVVVVVLVLVIVVVVVVLCCCCCSCCWCSCY